MLRNAAAVVLSFALVACGGGDGSSAGSVAASVSPTAFSDAASTALPVTAATEPSAFAGDDRVYLRLVRRLLEELEVASDLTDARLVALGRQFCSVLSGGGRVTDKVDFWAGLNRLGNGPDRPIFTAAWDEFCPELKEGYQRMRLSPLSAGPSPREQEDLARFVHALRSPEFKDELGAVTTERLVGDASTLCGLSFRPGWSASSPVTEVLRGLPRRAQVTYVVGLVLAYCSEHVDAMRSEFGTRSGA